MCIGRERENQRQGLVQHARRRADRRGQERPHADQDARQSAQGQVLQVERHGRVAQVLSGISYRAHRASERERVRGDDFFLN